MKAETTIITLPVTVLETGADKDIELEGTLADYLPNINRIIRADADLVCEDVQIKGSKAEVNGKAVFSLLYESDFKQKLKRERFETEFSQRFDLKDLPEGELLPTARVKCSYVGCKTLNPRRFILRCRGDITLNVKCMQMVSVVSMADSKGAFFKSESLSVAEYAPDILRDFNMEETISLETAPSIGEIIYTTLDFSTPEISKNNGSALIRSEGTFKCLYEPEDEEGELQMAVRRFPVAMTLEDDSISEDSDLFPDLAVGTVEAEKDLDAYGENRVIQLKYGARVTLGCTNRKEITLPTDMFFEEYKNENKTTTLPYEKPVKEIKHRFSVDKVFDSTELSMASCLDLNADASVTEATLGEEGISVKGNCEISLFGLENGYRSKDSTLPFSALIPFDAQGKECFVKATANAKGGTAEMAGGRVSVRVPVELSVSVTYKEKLGALTSAEIEKRTEEDEHGTPVIIYYPSKGETAWDIGKRYFTDPEKVKENNPDAFDKNGNVTESGTALYM